jgi:signal transduction histidine kinase/CheY-like chemotaxis protein
MRTVRVGLFSVLVTLVPLVILGLLTMWLSQHAVRDEVESKLTLTTALSGSLVSEHFRAMVAVVDDRAKSEGLVRATADGNSENFDDVEINRQLQELFGSRSDLTGVALMDVHGVLRASATSPQLIGRDFSDRGYFQGVVATGEPFVSGVFASASTGATRYVVSIAAYVRAESAGAGPVGRPLAVLVASIGLDDIQTVVDDLARAQGVNLWVTDQNGIVVAKPGGLPSNLEPVADEQIGAAATLPSGELGAIGLDANEALVVREVAGPPGWALFATIGRDEAYAGADRIRVAVLAIGIPLALVVCAGITVLLMMQRRQWAAGVHLSGARDEAREANRRKSYFLANMSHELRTPLNSILGFGRLLELDKLTTQQRVSVSYMVQSGEHLLGLIDEVLDISRMERGQMRLSMESVSAHDVIEGAIGMCRPLADRRGIRIFDESPPDQRYIRADRQRFKQVLVNLLANAVKYNRDGGEIRVTLTSEHVGTWRVSVIDTGIGVAGDDLGRLFQPFERLSADGTGVEGTGLGLALSKKLMIAMDGEVGVSSRVGEGSTFWVELPVAEPPVEGGRTNPTADQASLAPVSGPSVTVLYIEDNLTNVRLLEQVMRLRPNVDLMVAMQGRIGLQMALDHRPGIVLLDLHLPDMSGNEVLRSLRADERTAATPVVILSADATSGQSSDHYPAGATAFLSKPFDIAILLQLIDELGGSSDMPTVGKVVLPVPNPLVAVDVMTTDGAPDDASDSAIEDFAHELINMLGVIVTYCDLMTHAASDPATVSYLARAGAAAGLAVDLTREFVLAHSVGEPVGVGRVAERGAPAS